MMEESIYNLIPQPVEVQQKPAPHKSKHNPKAPPTFSTFGLHGSSKPGYANVGGATNKNELTSTISKPHATFGKEGNARAPTDMLKKGDGLPKAAPPPTKFTYAETEKKPGVPTAAACAAAVKAKPPAEPKNFVTSNAVENILAVPKREPEEVDWMKKPSYGKTPGYLQKIKKEIHDEYEYIRSMQQQQEEAGPPGMRMLGEDERLMLINDLKGKWDEVNALYQQTSVLSLASLDTIGKVKRKEMYEAQLAQIEKDIEKLSKKCVYVREDE